MLVLPRACADRFFAALRMTGQDYSGTALHHSDPKPVTKKTLFDMDPENVVLNYDDLNYETFKDFKGKKRTITYGHASSDVKILSSKLYKKGTVVTISTNSEIRTYATFVPGETAVSYMAAAVAIAELLDIKTDTIIEGIANYDYDK